MVEFADLTEDQKARVKACKTTDELVALAKEEGIEITDEQLEAVSGGMWGDCDNHTCTCYDDCPDDGCHAVKICPDLGK